VRRKPNGPKFVAARRKPSGLSASFRAKPGGLRRSATSVRHNFGAIGRKPPGQMRRESPFGRTAYAVPLPFRWTANRRIHGSRRNRAGESAFRLAWSASAR